MTNLILSLFPGIGLLDMAFEEAGFCVVRGPDVLWGGDVHCFHPPAGRFDGVIGGPPCQAFSTYANLNRHQGKKVAEDLVPEFARIISEARPRWWLMENAPGVPTLTVDGYRTHRVTWDNRWSGGEQKRRRAFQFGTPECIPLHIDGVALYAASTEATCLASEGATGRISHNRTADGSVRASYKPRRDWARFCELQGLSPDFLTDAPFTAEGRYRVVGNGVPLPMGRAIARAAAPVCTGGRSDHKGQSLCPAPSTPPTHRTAALTAGGHAPASAVTPALVNGRVAAPSAASPSRPPTGARGRPWQPSPASGAHRTRPPITTCAGTVTTGSCSGSPTPPTSASGAPTAPAPHEGLTMHPPTSRDVIGAVCADYDLDPAHLVGPARDAAAVEARDAAVLLLVELCGLQQTAATRRVGRMPDPTPLARARRRRERDAAFRERVGALSRALQGEAPARCPHCGGAL